MINMKQKVKQIEDITISNIRFEVYEVEGIEFSINKEDRDKIKESTTTDYLINGEYVGEKTYYTIKAKLIELSR